VAEAPRRECPVHGDPPKRPERLRRLLDGLRVWQVHESRELGEEFDELFLASRDHYGALVERDSRYLRWRYLERPDASYSVLAVERRGRLCGWGVFARRQDDLVWGDALFRPEHAKTARDLLAEAVRRSGKPPVTRVVAWFPAHPSWWDHALGALGFASRPEPQGLGLMIVPFLDAEAHRWTGESWYYAYGDSDLF
jgi:hypothetical protein